MNIRKNIDYTEMYEALDELMSQQLSQMELYWGIGKAVCRRTEKGAAVMASEYLNKHYPDVKGFSPRSLRRIRDFYRTYENHPALLSRAMKLGWTQNVVIMEADLTMELREWYIRAALQFGWSKSELIGRITDKAHEEITISVDSKSCYTEATDTTFNGSVQAASATIRYRKQPMSVRVLLKHGEINRRRWSTILCPIFIDQRMAFLRC